ncbi:WG repeat-containing protein [Luteolibacter marinus]|uniref:WG repeat-containing protein n=1 Tax=Luteolibacter marinus TaxID=2776705 RepID=UPI001868EDCC|nr:WG repeat-containing protein [Luteolibacter marinus]
MPVIKEDPAHPPALEVTVRRYIELSQSAGPREWSPLVFPADIDSFHAQVTAAAEILEPLGEAQGLLRNAGVGSVAELTAMAPLDLFCAMLDQQFASIRRRAPGELAKLLESVRLDRIVAPSADSPPGSTWKIEYSFLFQNEQLQINRRLSEEAEVIESGGKWFIRLRPAMHSFATRARNQVADFHARAARDLKDGIANPDDELEEVRLSGFRRVDDKRIVIEPRFSYAREFYQGLAAVRVMSTWGYIKADGSWAVEPRFSDAKDFADGLAPVALEDTEEERWGYIDRGGREVIALTYGSAREFSEGLAAVEKDGRWGFIDPKGGIVIPFRYSAADSFSEGHAEVEWENEDGEEESGFIDRAGRLVSDDEGE